MKFSVLKLTAALAVAQPGIPNYLAKRADWTGSCLPAGFLQGTTILSAVCRRGDGSENFTELELNNCFNNNNGQIYYGGSGFGYSCGNCSLDSNNATMVCNCRANDGTEKNSMIDTDLYLSNQNGNLACD